MMKTSLLFEIKKYTAYAFGGFLVISILTVDWNDPTFFNQVYPVDGIKNWFGVMGAIMGGTLIELFGPSIILFPWFLIRISQPRVWHHSLLAAWYHAIVIILMLSILHTLFQTQPPSGISENFFFHTGYIGILGKNWLDDTMGIELGGMAAFVVLFFSSAKIYILLPFQPMIHVALFSYWIILKWTQKLFNLQITSQMAWMKKPSIQRMRNRYESLIHNVAQSSAPTYQSLETSSDSNTENHHQETS